MAIKMKVLKKRGQKLVRAGAASIQSGAETAGRAARSGATRARVAAGAAGALAVVGAGMAARKVRKVMVRRKVRKAMARVDTVAHLLLAGLTGGTAVAAAATGVNPAAASVEG